MGVLIGIDIGGTFTDIVGIDLQNKEIQTLKVPTTNDDHSQGFMLGIKNVLDKMNRHVEDVIQIVHGTTVGTNAILEEKGAKIGILTTEGFEDTLEIGRQKRSDMYNLFMDPETPIFLCPRKRIIGIEERIDPHTGKAFVPIDEKRILQAVKKLVEEYGVESIAVNYLFSFINPEHEKITEQIINENYPQISVSLSSQVDPQFREYERLCLTAFDAYVKPVVGRYLEKLQNKLSEEKIQSPIYIMLSQGGVTEVETLKKRSVGTLLSGVAAGVLGGKEAGRQSNENNVITLDVGGTSADVSLIVEGKSLIATEGVIRSYPLRIPMVDIHTIGAGGGSIAYVDEAKNLRVGPESAGAIPGPACYGRGGQRPTITDASLILGYLNEKGLAGGSLPLNKTLAKKAIEKHVSEPLGLDLIKAAMGIHQIINAKMADAIRLVTVKRGYDPRIFALVSFGGAGGLHACAIADELDINKIIIPATPGVLSANGLIVSNIEAQEWMSYTENTKKLDLTALQEAITRLENKCLASMLRHDISASDLQRELTLMMRYVGQSYDIPVSVSLDESLELNIDRSIKDFHQYHEQIYGHSDPNNETEIVSLRVTYKYPILDSALKLELHRSDNTLNDSSEVIYREVYFDRFKEFVKTPVYDKSKLSINERTRGPLIVEQADTTILVNPGWSVIRNDNGNLVLERSK